jgi:hypothetical protein
MTVRFCRGACSNYIDHFPNGTILATAPQCTDWNGWRTALPTSRLLSLTMWGTEDNAGVSCTDPTTVQAIADALRTNTAGSWSCDGRTWRTGNCGSGIELSAMGSICSCPDPGYIARPCINNNNWGGMSTDTCGAPTQDMGVDFCGVDSVLFSEDFTNGSTSTAQCTVWNTWRGDLTGSFSSVTMRGSLDETGITCSDSTTATAIASALNTLTSGSWSCDGHTWYLCASRYSGELWIDAPSLCSGANCPDPGYLVRPCIGNVNWGGVGTDTCGGPTQRMDVEFYR